MVGLSSQLRRETLKTTRIEITYTVSAQHGFKHLAIFLRCNPTLARMPLLHQITSDRKITYELLVIRGCPLSHTFCVWVTFRYPVHDVTQCAEQPATEIEFGHTFTHCQGNCASSWPSHPSLCCGLSDSGSALHCSYFNWYDFGGGVTV